MIARPFLAALAGAATSVAVATISFPAHAATNLNSSRSNIYKTISSAADEAACLKVAGTVVVQGGKKLCLMPATSPSTIPGG